MAQHLPRSQSYSNNSMKSYGHGDGTYQHGHNNKLRSESISANSTLSSFSSSSHISAATTGLPHLMATTTSYSVSPHTHYMYYSSPTENRYQSDTQNTMSTGDYDGRFHFQDRQEVASPAEMYSLSPLPRSANYSYSVRHGFDTRSSYATEEDLQQQALASPIKPSISSNSFFQEPSSSSSQLLSPLPPLDKLRYPVFPPTEEMKQKANKALLASEATFKVIYAGDAIYKPDKKILSKSKKVHFVLTNNQLLTYKSSQKARSEINIFEHHHQNDDSYVNQTISSKVIDKDRVFLHLSSIFAVQMTATAASTFRIEYFHPQSGQALVHTLTAENEREARQWVQALRKAVRVHHPRIDSIAPTERYNVLDRMAKQSDSFSNTDQVLMYKVVFKEKRYKVAGSDVLKEVFLPVIFAIGKFSFYLLPISVLDDEYLKTVERDRFGLLSINTIRYDNVDDTIVIDVKQVGKSNRQLAFASTFCEDIIQHLYRSINAIIPHSASDLYSENMPLHIKNTQVVPLKISVDPEDEITDDAEVKQFNTILRAYAASMNMNKSRFNFTIEGSGQARVFTLLPPNEIGGSPAEYERYELLALFRTIQASNIFVEISLAHCPLNSLENWEAQPNHAWTLNKSQPQAEKNILANELYTVLTKLKCLRKLDLTNCSIGKPSKEESAVSLHHTFSAISIIGTAMRSGKTHLSRINISQNEVSDSDLSKLMAGIKEHKKSIKELCLSDCGLEKDMMEFVLRTLYEKSPDQIITLDLSTNTKNDPFFIEPSLVSRLIPSFKRLEVLRIRGHHLLSSNYNFMLESSHLRELDLGGCKMDSNVVARICKWMSTPSFSSIEALHLADCGLNGKHVYDLLISISQSGNRDIHLNLERNPIMKEVMHLPKLHSAILQSEGPKSISFACIEWDDSTLREFIDCLRDNHAITHLDLSDICLRDTDEISQDTIRMMTSLFERNASIIELKLNFNLNKSPLVPLSAFQPKPLICKAIVQALPGLRHNCTLRHLDVSRLNMEDAGALALARVLKTNKHLQSVIIDENNISIEGYRSLVKSIEESATQVINVPAPRKDLRTQLAYLAFRIEELIITENEAQFFLIHTTASDKKKAKKHELEMVAQERRKCEMALQNFEKVIHALTIAVRKNVREFEEQTLRNMQFQMQAQTAAQELAMAQVRLQGRSPSAMSGANLSAIGVATRTRHGSSSNASTTSSANSSVYSSISRSTSRNTYSNHQLLKINSRRSVISSEYPQSPVSPNSYSKFSGNNAYMVDTTRTIPPRPTYTNNDTHNGAFLGKPHSYDGADMLQGTVNLPVTPSVEYPDPYYRNHQEFSETSNIFHPSQLIGEDFRVDDPGFVADFGYVDDFEQSTINPSYLSHHQEAAAAAAAAIASNGNEFLYSGYNAAKDEEILVQRFDRGLYLPPDARD